MEVVITQSENLLAVHLSDNGISFNQDVRDELLDMMGLSNTIFNVLDDEKFKIN